MSIRKPPKTGKKPLRNANAIGHGDKGITPLDGSFAKKILKNKKERTPDKIVMKQKTVEPAINPDGSGGMNILKKMAKPTAKEKMAPVKLAKSNTLALKATTSLIPPKSAPFKKIEKPIKQVQNTKVQMKKLKGMTKPTPKKTAPKRAIKRTAPKR